MARTQGHGNPDWSREETILALALLTDCQLTVPSKSDPRLIELSDFLRSMPFHPSASRRASFRNVDGVAFKLQNLRQVATQRGLDHVSAMDRLIWADFANEPKELSEAANRIRRGVSLISQTESTPDEECEEFVEGRVVTLVHLRRERNVRLRRRFFENRCKSGPLACEMCSFGGENVHKDYRQSLFEAHHIVPLSTKAEGKIQLKDLALLCANCHRVIHRTIASEKRWLSVDDARKFSLTGGRNAC